jgi:hypothetical protein
MTKLQTAEQAKSYVTTGPALALHVYKSGRRRRRCTVRVVRREVNLSSNIHNAFVQVAPSWRASMGAGASVPAEVPASAEDALEAGYTQEQIDEYVAAQGAAPEDAAPRSGRRTTTPRCRTHTPALVICDSSCANLVLICLSIKRWCLLCTIYQIPPILHPPV